MCNENTNDPFTLCSNYISGNFLVFKKLEKNKPKQPENLSENIVIRFSENEFS